jgi:hypothetical protein
MFMTDAEGWRDGDIIRRVMDCTTRHVKSIAYRQLDPDASLLVCTVSWQTAGGVVRVGFLNAA